LKKTAASVFTAESSSVPDISELRGLSRQNDRTVTFEVEELFVKPDFRRKGYGKALVRQLGELADEGNIKVWVSYADSSPANLVVIEKLVMQLSIHLQPSPERWAPLVAM
jgi:GNAT superfamily N-acetyltransferase